MNSRNMYIKLKKSGAFIFIRALYRYPTIIATRVDQVNRGTLKKHLWILHNIRIDISPRIQSTFEVQLFRWKVERTLLWFQRFSPFTKDFYSDAKCIISHIHTLSRRFWLYADRFLMSFTINFVCAVLR